jgi:hypothetical protein
MTIRTWDLTDIGCYIDEANWGWRGQRRLVDLAHDEGMPLDDDEKVILDAFDTHGTFYKGEPVDEVTLSTGEKCDPIEAVNGQGGMADVAEEWLNENCAPEGYEFGWCDGSFFFEPDAWWEEGAL